MATRSMNPFVRMAAGLYEFGWELRRGAYARGWFRPGDVSARVVSVGNLTVGGTGKTTLVLHLAQRAKNRGVRCGVVCRRYRPGPAGRGDEELLYAAALGDRHVYAGTSKRELAERAADDGAELIIVDDGFSHWPLARDLDVVLVDSMDPWGGGALIPAGRLREPLRALQRAGVLVASRLGPGEVDLAAIREIQARAPGAFMAAGRHRPDGFTDLEGAALSTPARAHLITATGNPEAVLRTAREAGVDVASHRTYRDHHWFTDREINQELQAASTSGALLLLTAKDAVRWPAGVPREGVGVLRVTWEWAMSGERAEELIFGGEVHATG